MSEMELKEWKQIQDSLEYDSWLDNIDEEFYGSEEI